MRIKPDVYLYGSPKEKPTRWNVHWKEKVHGVTHSRKSGFDSREKALEYATKVDAVVTRHKATQSLVRTELGQPGRIEVLLPQYLEHLKSIRRNPEHIYNVKKAMHRLLKWRLLQLCDEITYSILRDYHQTLRNLADDGRKDIGMIQTFLGRQHNHNNIIIDPKALRYGRSAEIAAPREPYQPGCYDTDQINEIITLLTSKIIYAANLDDKMNLLNLKRHAFFLIFIFLLRYGFRPCDAADIKIKWWDQKERKLILPPKNSNKSRPRVVDVDKLTAQLIDASIAGRSADEYLFIPKRARNACTLPQWHTWELGVIMRGILKELGIRGSLYWLRHTAITNLCLRHNGDLAMVASITGHKQIKTLTRYLKIQDNRRKIVADFFDTMDQQLPDNIDIRNWIQPTGIDHTPHLSSSLTVPLIGNDAVEPLGGEAKVDPESGNPFQKNRDPGDVHGDDPPEQLHLEGA